MEKNSKLVYFFSSRRFEGCQVKVRSSSKFRVDWERRGNHFEIDTKEGFSKVTGAAAKKAKKKRNEEKRPFGNKQREPRTHAQENSSSKNKTIKTRQREMERERERDKDKTTSQARLIRDIRRRSGKVLGV